MSIELDTTDDPDPLEIVEEHEAALETLADRDDRIGAGARISLALARDDRPDPYDLEELGIPVGPAGDLATQEGTG